MICGIAMGAVHGRLSTRRPRVAVEGNTRGVAMRETLVNACVGTDGEGQCAEEPITPRRMELSERTAELQPSEHLGVTSLPKEEGERFIGKKWRREGHRCIGTAQAIADHPSHGFTRCEGFLLIGRKACLKQVDATEVFDR
jgi:hypothetical protein